MTTFWEIDILRAVAGDVFDGFIIFFAVPFPLPWDALDKIWDFIESVSEGFLPTFAWFPETFDLKDMFSEFWRNKKELWYV